MHPAVFPTNLHSIQGGRRGLPCHVLMNQPFLSILFLLCHHGGFSPLLHQQVYYPALPNLCWKSDPGKYCVSKVVPLKFLQWKYRHGNLPAVPHTCPAPTNLSWHQFPRSSIISLQSIKKWSNSTTRLKLRFSGFQYLATSKFHKQTKEDWNTVGETHEHTGQFVMFLTVGIHSNDNGIKYCRQKGPARKTFSWKIVDEGEFWKFTATIATFYFP